MTLQIELSPQTEAWIQSEADRQGILPVDLVKTVLNKRAATPAGKAPIADEHDATIALLQSWIDEDATDDPETIQQAEADLREFKRNMNAPRKEAGERLLFPEVE